MDYGDCYWGIYRDYYRDPSPHSLLSTRELFSSCPLSSWRLRSSTYVLLSSVEQEPADVLVGVSRFCKRALLSIL